MGRYTARIRKIVVVGCAGLLLVLPALAATPSKSTRHSSSSAKLSKAKAHSSKSKKSSHSASAKKGKQAWRSRQAAIDNMRVREIQSALIRAHYLDGEPNGSWDSRTKSAMEKFQSDNGWQTKKVPDSRALIKLGLGPDRANLINPETAFIGMPEPGKGGAPASNGPQN